MTLPYLVLLLVHSGKCFRSAIWTDIMVHPTGDTWPPMVSVVMTTLLIVISHAQKYTHVQCSAVPHTDSMCHIGKHSIEELESVHLVRVFPQNTELPLVFSAQTCLHEVCHFPLLFSMNHILDSFPGFMRLYTHSLASWDRTLIPWLHGTVHSFPGCSGLYTHSQAL